MVTQENYDASAKWLIGFAERLLTLGKELLERGKELEEKHKLLRRMETLDRFALRTKTSRHFDTNALREEVLKESYVLHESSKEWRDYAAFYEFMGDELKQNKVLPMLSCN